jgi:hypothetical protein
MFNKFSTHFKSGGYSKASMVVAVLAAYREQGIGLLYKCKWYYIRNNSRRKSQLFWQKNSI